MQVATGGPACAAHLRNRLPHVDRIAAADRDRFQVVVGGDEAVAVIDLDPVAAAPGMPPRRTDHAGVRRIDRGSACG